MKQYLTRYNIATALATIGSILSVIGWIIFFKEGSGHGNGWMAYGACFAFLSYIFGGLLTAFQMALGIAKWGFLIVPFPFNLLTGVAAFFIAIIVLLFVPIFPVLKAKTLYQNG